jgi:hypothetical protein
LPWCRHSLRTAGIATNPCERGGRLYRAERVDRIWTEAMIGRAIAGLPDRLRAALLLALWTGQRQGDLLRLPWSAYEDGSSAFANRRPAGAS